MTNKKKTEKVMYENPDGEIFDVDGAFMRHPTITPGKANIDLWVKAERYNGLYFELRLSAKTMARLVQILNAAPVNGDPLNAIVNLWGDTTVTEVGREDILYFLSENGYDATLENIAAGYLYEVGENKPLGIDVIHIEDLEGVIIGNGTWRILHALEPGGKAPLGGFILERV